MALYWRDGKSAGDCAIEKKRLDYMMLPTFCSDLIELRQTGKRPLGGIVLTDSWRAAQNAKLVDLFPIYLRARDDWTAYDLAALSGLDVLVHVVVESDPTRIDALIQHVKSYAPRSLRLSTPDRSEVLAGKDHAYAELIRWTTARAKRAISERAAA